MGRRLTTARLTLISAMKLNTTVSFRVFTASPEASAMPRGPDNWRMESRPLTTLPKTR